MSFYPFYSPSCNESNLACDHLGQRSGSTEIDGIAATLRDPDQGSWDQFAILAMVAV